MTGSVLTEVEGAVLTITINRPERRNAVDKSTAETIGAAADRLDDDDQLRVAILTGADGTFCAGMDLKAFAAGERPVTGERGFAGICTVPPQKPIIAAGRLSKNTLRAAYCRTSVCVGWSWSTSFR
jgi:enoyl-CoA hydratase